MAKKKASKASGTGDHTGKSGGMTKRPPTAQQMSVAELMEHPLVQQMSSKIEALQGMLSDLPEAIGRAVESAIDERERRKHPPTVPSSRVTPLTGAGIKITKQGTTRPGQKLERVRPIGYKSPPVPPKKSK